MVVAKDQSEAIAAYYQSLNRVNASWLRFKLKGLHPDKKYQVTNPYLSHEAYGDELMEIGLVLRRKWLNLEGGDFASLIFNLKEC